MCPPISAKSCATDKDIFDFLSETTEAEFLLDKDLARYLWEELHHKAALFETLNAELSSLVVGGERSKNVQQQREIKDWFEKQYEVLNDKFRQYLTVEH